MKILLWGVFVPGGIVLGVFVQGVFVGGFMSGFFYRGGFVLEPEELEALNEDLIDYCHNTCNVIVRRRSAVGFCAWHLK